MFNIALYEPNIPQNTGNIIRLIANNGCHLHLIEPLGFDFEDKQLKRAGLDYHDLANVTRHSNFEVFSKTMAAHRIFALTTRGTNSYCNIRYEAGDILLFGSETAGLPEYVRQFITSENHLKIPMMPNNRSMNLSNTVAIVSYEAWRQTSFLGSE